jgi:hypothetical protein
LQKHLEKAAKWGMIHRFLETTLRNFLTADGRSQTAAGEESPSTVGRRRSSL